MVIDSSALIAILLGESETRNFSMLIAADSKRLISAFSALETSMVIETRKGEAGGLELDLLLHRAQYVVTKKYRYRLHSSFDFGTYVTITLNALEVF